MKTLPYLSPTSISTYLQNKEQFYLKYLSDNRPERELQTAPMSVGSSFDAHIKAHLRAVLFGEDESSLFDKYFTDAVEEQNRDFALPAGKRCFINYKVSGALSDLIIDMQKARETPRFEFTVSNVGSEGNKLIKEYAGGVKFLGKPDAWYVNSEGAHIILDWKVNGYCSKASPTKGYVMLRDGVSAKASRGAGGPHKDCLLVSHHGVLIDSYHKMEDKNVDWARQLAIYAWLCGENVGAEIIGAIDQIVSNERGELRIAEHRCLIGSDFQIETFNTAKEIWNRSSSPETFFGELSTEQSAKRCAGLDLIKDVQQDPMYKAMYGKS